MIAAAAPRRGSFPLTHSCMLITAHFCQTAQRLFGRRAVRPRLFPLPPSLQCRLFRHAHLLRAVVTSSCHRLCFGPAHIDENLWGSAAYST
eukprot:scaffold113331_cov113-Phaeocystis_antarctica.AAC.2